MQVKKLTLSALLVALGTLTSNLVYVPVGIAKCYPVQHTINVLSAVLLGPGYALGNAFTISLLRNMLGTGSLLAFPGSMLGALLAAIVFFRTGNQFYAVLGEIVGTGILGSLAAYPVAKYVLGKEVVALFFLVPFLISTIGGSIIGYLLLRYLGKDNFFKKEL